MSLQELLDGNSSDMLLMIVFGFLLSSVLVVGFCVGMCVATQRAQQRYNQEKKEGWIAKYEDAKLMLHQCSAEELREACGRVQFQCGTGATKEAMARGLLAEHGFELQSLALKRGGLLGALLEASGGEAVSSMQSHGMRAGAPASEHGRSVREDVKGAQRRRG